MLQVCLCYADAVVSDWQRDLHNVVSKPAAADCNLDKAALARELDRVRDKVDKDLLSAQRVNV